MATPNQQETCQTEQQYNTVEYVESVEPCMSHDEECMVPHLHASRGSQFELFKARPCRCDSWLSFGLQRRASVGGASTLQHMQQSQTYRSRRNICTDLQLSASAKSA